MPPDSRKKMRQQKWTVFDDMHLLGKSREIIMGNPMRLLLVFMYTRLPPWDLQKAARFDFNHDASFWVK